MNVCEYDYLGYLNEMAEEYFCELVEVGVIELDPCERQLIDWGVCCG